MPYYEYVCSDCTAGFELKRAMKEIDDPATCPDCHGEHVARQISKVAAFAHGESGSTTSLGGGGGCGGSCGSGGCGGGSCGSCASKN